MKERFKIVAEVIRNRRSIKPVKMNGKKIPENDIREILQLANWAPTHGRTEPWRFMVYADEKVKEFCSQHAAMYKLHTSPEKFEESTYNKQLHNGDLASYLIIAIMQRGKSPKIPALEEIAATAVSVQNILLGATAAGIASFWSTGGMTHHREMKVFLGLKDDDVVMGLLYLGYSDELPEGRRQTGIDEKLIWK